MIKDYSVALILSRVLCLVNHKKTSLGFPGKKGKHSLQDAIFFAML